MMLHRQAVNEMTLQEAIKIAEKFRGDKIGAIKDCGDRWAFAFKADEECLGSAPVFVFKSDGRCEFFFIGDEFDILKSGIPIDLPEE